VKNILGERGRGAWWG